MFSGYTFDIPTKKKIENALDSLSYFVGGEFAIKTKRLIDRIEGEENKLEQLNKVLEFWRYNGAEKTRREW